MKKAIKITGDQELINQIIDQVKLISREEANHINFIGRNEFSMIGMMYNTEPDPGSDNIDLIIEAENPMLFYKLGLYTAPIIKEILK